MPPADVPVKLMLLVGVLNPQEVYRAIDWSVIFMVAAFLPVGAAFVSIGTVDFVARGILVVTTWASPEMASYVALATIYQVTSALTQMWCPTMPPRSSSRRSRWLMVYGAGGYKFLDYTRFGAPLNLLFWLLATLLIPVFWSF